MWCNFDRSIKVIENKFRRQNKFRSAGVFGSVSFSSLSDLRFTSSLISIGGSKNFDFGGCAGIGVDVADENVEIIGVIVVPRDDREGIMDGFPCPIGLRILLFDFRGNTDPVGNKLHFIESGTNGATSQKTLSTSARGNGDGVSSSKMMTFSFHYLQHLTDSETSSSTSTLDYQ